MALLNAQKTTDHSTHIMSWLQKRFLDRLEKKFHFAKFAKRQKLKKGDGKTVTWTRWTNVSESTTALTESESPDGVSLSSSQVTATVAGYGQFATTSDFLVMTAINDQLKDMVDLLGYAAGASIDALIRNVVDAGGTAYHADEANNSSASDVQTGTDSAKSSDLRGILKVLHTADVPSFDDGLFKAIIHPIMEFDLLSETTADSILQQVANVDGDPARKGMIGKAYGIELFRSTHIRAGVEGSDANVYRCVVLGKDAYGIVDPEGSGLKMIMKQLGSAGSEDPLDQRATVGYKFYQAVAVLEAARAITYKVYGA